MLRFIFPILLVATTPTFAADGDTPIKGGPPGTNVELPYLMAPLQSADGKLAGYAYISARLTASSSANALNVRDRLAFLQDAFVRDVNGAAIADRADAAAVDIAAVEARLLADAKRVIGEAEVRAITVCTIQVADLHPRQTQPDPTKPPPESRCAAE